MNKERLFMRKNSILIRLIKILFLFFCMSLNSVFADTWQIALIDKPKIISSMTQRSIALERNTNYPHMAYGGDHLYHTYYNGTAWQYETADMSNGVGEKASIAIDLNNKTYISYSDGGLKYATNASGSWVTTLVEGGSYGGNTSIAIDANNKSHISYFDFTNKLKYATNASGEWITIDVDISGNVADYASIAVDSNNKAHISYYYYTNGYLKYATNESGAWVISTVDTSGNLFYPSLAIDSNNKIHISYYNDDTSDLKYATNATGSWVKSIAESSGDVGAYTSIGIDTNNKIHISYYDLLNSNLKYTTNTSGSWVASTIESSGDVGTNTSIAIGTNNKVYISYFNETNSTLKYATNLTGSWVLTVLDSSKDVGKYTSIAVDSNNKVHISYYNNLNGNSNGDLKYATNVSGTWVETTVDSIGDAGSYTYIAIDNNNKVHISYCYISNLVTRLKYATNTSGSWVTTTVDSNIYVGTYSSIALDPDNKVHISYFDEANYDLKYATNASGAWVLSTLDSNGNVGIYTSIALDSSNKVYISYFDVSNYNLKYITNESGVWIDTILDDFGSFAGGISSIGIDTNNKIHISYTTENGNVKYATNASGSWVYATLDNSASEYISMAIDTNNKIHIGYYYSGNNVYGVKYLTNISGSWVITIVDNSGYLGKYTSIALDANNKVHISYYENTNLDLKYATNDESSFPIANAGIDQTVNKRTPVTLNGSASSDPNGDFITYSWTQTSGTNVALSNSNSVNPSFTPNTAGTYIFQLIVNDGQNNSSPDSVTITVNNNSPVANDDSKTTNEDTVTTINVLTNDTDADSDALTVTGFVAINSKGVKVINENGTITYTPNANANGADSFTYSISDGDGGTSTATVNITITPVNDAPIAIDDSKTTNEDTVTTISVLANDTDIDGDTLSVSGVTQGAKGSVVNNNGIITYTPNANLNGADSFTYTISDGNGGTSTATVNITITSVNDAPIAVNDSKTTNEDTLTTIDVLINDTDLEGDPLSVVGVTQGAKGSVTNNNGTITYTPNANLNGADSFTYTISDGNGGTAIGTVNVTIVTVNDAPIAVNDSKTTNEDTLTTIDVLINDTDAEGDTVSVTVVTQGAKGSVTNNNGTITYTPNANLNGADSFTYTISDGNGGTAIGTVNVTIVTVNDAPIAVNDSKTTNEDTATTISVLTNDTDIDGDTLSVLDVTQGVKGSVVNNNGTITYTPNVSVNGADSFTYTISDGNGGTSIATVNITITPINDAPIAVNDSKTTDEDTVTTINVLTNDTDADGDIFLVSGVTQGAKGSVVNNNGIITYTPNANANGADSFTYTISDGNGGTSIATVNITITLANDSPVANNDFKTTDEDTATIINVLTNDTDIDGDILLVSGVTQGAKGFVVNNNGIITYTPNANANGADSFTYTISDGNGGISIATVNITITLANDSPVANNDSKITNEDTVTTINVLTNDTDADGDTLSVSVVTQGVKGSVVNNNGTITYTPNLSLNGADSFTYTISDGNGGTSTATVNITITPINDAPIAVNDSKITDEDTATTINVLTNDTDADGDIFLVSGVTQGAKGSVVNNNGIITYTPNANANGADNFTYTISDGNNGTSTATVNVTIIAINDLPIANAGLDQMLEVGIQVTLNASFSSDIDGDSIIYLWTQTSGPNVILSNSNSVNPTFTPNTSGTYIFQLIVNDGQVNSISDSVTFSVNNSIPVANNDSKTTNEDIETTINVLTNDIDADGDPLSVIGVTQGSKGSVVNNNGTITYTPNASLNGADSFTYTVSDGKGGTSIATVNITIISINDAPVANNDSKTTNEDTATTINVLTNDTDAEGDTLLVIGITQGTKGSVLNSNGIITYTPNVSLNGADSFTYSISDGNGGTSTAIVNITIISVNDAPIAVNDSKTTNEDTVTTINVLTNDTDIEGDILSVSGVTQGVKGSVVNNNGTITYTPNANLNGVDSFTYTISDGNSGTSTATVNLTITSVNDAPIAVNDSKTTNEDTVTTINVLTNDADADGDTLSVSGVTQGAKGSVVNNSGTITYTPNANLNGADSFTYTISDGNSGTSTATVNITITSVNDAPIAVNDSKTTNEDTVTTINVLTNDIDIEGDILSVSGVTQGVKGSVVNNNGTITYTPNVSVNGADSFTYTISDGNGGTSIATVNITITSVNDVSIAVNDSKTTNEDTVTTINVLTNDIDIDGDALLVTGVTQGSIGSVVNNNGILSYTPNANLNGADSFTYTISDGNGGIAIGTVNIIITSVNDTPIAINDSKITNEDTVTTINVLTNDTDIDGDILSVSGVTQGSKGSVVNNNGTITYTPNANLNGADSFTYTISDGNGGISTATVNIIITATNDLPIANAGVDQVFNVGIPVTLNGSSSNDIDSDFITYSWTQTSGPNVVLSNSFIVNPTFTSNVAGTYIFQLIVNDSQFNSVSDSVIFNINNEIPVANNDSKTTNEDTSTIINVLTNDTDVDGDILSVSGVTQGAKGSVVNNNGVITYTSNANANGADSFTYSISDGKGGSSTATVNITIIPINDEPVAINDSITTDEDTSVTIDVLTNDTDTEGNILSVSSVTQGVKGSVVNNMGIITYTPNANINGVDDFTYTISDGNGGTNIATVNITITPINDALVAVNDSKTTNEDTEVTIDVLTNDIDTDGDILSVTGVTQGAKGSAVNSNGLITYTPKVNINGADSFTYTISDGNGNTSTTTVNITIISINDLPIANAGIDQLLDVGMQITLNGSFSNDIDGDLITYSWTQTSGSNVILSDSKIVNPTFIPNVAGTYIFQLIVNDGQSDSVYDSVTINVNNELPVANDDSKTTNEDTEVTIDVLANDTDSDGDILSVTGVTQGIKGSAVNNNGIITYTSNANANGADSFTYSITDGKGATSTSRVNITITPINDVPIAENDSKTINEDTTAIINVLTNDTDADEDILLVSGVTQGVKGIVVNNNGLITYAPNANTNGADSFTYSISDGNGGISTATVNITITAINDLPIANAGPDQTVKRGTQVTLSGSSSSDIDVDTIKYLWKQTRGTNVILSDSTSISPTFTPNKNGIYEFRLTVNDGQANSIPDSVVITINSSSSKGNSCLITNTIKNKNAIEFFSKIKDKYLFKNYFGKKIINLYYNKVGYGGI